MRLISTLEKIFINSFTHPKESHLHIIHPHHRKTANNKLNFQVEITKFFMSTSKCLTKYFMSSFNLKSNNKGGSNK